MDNEHRAAIATIPCKVSLGMFSMEWGVRIELPDERNIAALVDKDHVHVQEEPKSNTDHRRRQNNLRRRRLTLFWAMSW